ncbi:MAG: stage V sporulation protein S [Exiguobacterium sp.]|nr:stage V sporulation protein S [Exiguobacterium sp.]
MQNHLYLVVVSNRRGFIVSLPSEPRQTAGCLKVSSKSSPASVAGAIAGMIKDGVFVEIQAVGAGAVNQAVKAIAISRGFLSPIGIELVCAPSFADIVIDGEYRTAIRFSVEPRYSHGVPIDDSAHVGLRSSSDLS